MSDLNLNGSQWDHTIDSTRSLKGKFLIWYIVLTILSLLIQRLWLKTTAIDTKDFFIIFVIGLISTTLFYTIINILLRPLPQLIDSLRNIAKGNYNFQILTDTKDEFGAISKLLNIIISNFKEKIQNYKTEQDNLKDELTQHINLIHYISKNRMNKYIKDVKNPLLKPLADNLNKMIENLNNLSTQTREAASNLGTAVAQIMSTINEQAAAISEQSTSISEITSTLEELRQTAQQASDRAKKVADDGKELAKMAKEGLNDVKESIDSMKQIQEQSDKTAQNILELSERSQQIGEIISLIEEIADQSNLLALNASIEAARAGEAGKGFSVVASEVRNLAEQSRNATSEIKEILGDIQKQINISVLGMEEGAKKVKNGMERAHKVQDIINIIAQRIKEAEGAGHQIAITANQQLVGISQITEAMQNINKAGEESKIGMEQLESASHNLNSLAEQLNRILE